MTPDQQREYDDIEEKQRIIAKRLQEISEEEMRSTAAKSGGPASRGVFEKERERLLEQDRKLIARKAAILKSSGA